VPNYRTTDPEYWQGARTPLAGVKSKDFFLGPAERASPRANLLEMEPGFVIARHAHNTERFEVILKGSLYIGDEVYGPGDVMIAGPGEYYGPKVVGPQGCTTVEFFTAPVDDGPSLLFELADGTSAPFDPERGMPEGLAQQEWIDGAVAAVLREAHARPARA
jgi:hypothetical protein